MSDFATTYGDTTLVLTNDQEIILGTAQLGDQFGTIKRAVIKRTGDREIIQHAKTKKILLILIHNPGFEMTLECAFLKSVTPPGMGESLSLPLVGVTGHVMEGVTVQWESGSERGLSIPVSSWDVMQGATAYRLTPSGELLELGEAGLSAPSTSPVLSGTVTSSSISLSWTTVARATRYEVQVSSDGETWSTLIQPTGHSTIHSELDPESTRHYRVRAENSAGDGPWSDELELETSATAPTTAPALSGSALTTSYSTALNWNTNVAYAEDYELQVSSDGGSTWGALSIQATGSFTHNVNAAAAARKYRVRARNSVGNGPWSNVITLTTTNIGALTLTVSVLSDGVYLQWTTRAVATLYELQGSDDEETWTTLTETAGNSHTDNFIEGTRFYRVRASNALETGDWSATQSGTVGIGVPALSIVAVSREGRLLGSFAPVADRDRVGGTDSGCDLQALDVMCVPHCDGLAGHRARDGDVVRAGGRRRGLFVGAGTAPLHSHFIVSHGGAAYAASLTPSRRWDWSCRPCWRQAWRCHSPARQCGPHRTNHRP